MSEVGLLELPLGEKFVGIFAESNNKLHVYVFSQGEK
jgi:hypothetical protein